MRTITIQIKNAICSLACALLIGASGYSQVLPTPGAYQSDAMEYTNCYAAEVTDFKQGETSNGGAVPADRSFPERSLNEPDRSNADGGFVSLGMGGELTLKFSGAVYDMEGDDIAVWETTFSGDNCGGNNDEQALIQVSQDGFSWEDLGVICRDGLVDLEGMSYPYIQYIKITDQALSNGDGFDVDGVEALNGCSDVPVEDPNENCDDFFSFYAHNGAGGASSILYSMSFDNNEASFTELFDMAEFGGSVRVHISFDGQSNLLYAAQNNGDRIFVFKFDPNAGTLSFMSEIVPSGLEGSPSDLPSGIVQNVFYGGYIWLGSGSTDKVYQVSPSTGDFVEFSFDGGDGLTINGGDLVVKDGRVFSASRAGKKIYRLDFGADPASGTATVVNNFQGSNTPAKVNGMALSLGGNFIMANDNKEEMYVLDDQGQQLGTYPVVGLPFPENGGSNELLDGDIASGCSNVPSDENPCENYRAFYADHNGGPSTIYEVDFANPGSANFTEVFTLDYQAHITLNTNDGFIYAVNEDSGLIEKLNPNDGVVAGSYQLTPGDDSGAINSVYAMAFDSASGQIYVGSDHMNKIFRVTDLDDNTNTATYVYHADAPVQGGDLMFKEGRLYLATRSGNELRLVVGAGTSFIGNIESKVNGMALDPDGNLMTTNFNKNEVYAYDTNGGFAGSYAASGDFGNTNFKNGDLASGCPLVFPDPTCDIAPIENPGAEGAQEAKDNNDPDFNNGWEQYSSGQEPSWLKWSTTTSIEIQESGRVDGNDSYCGNFHFELLSRAVGDNMYQVIDTNPGAMVYVNFWHKKRRINGANPHDEMEVLAGDYDTFDNDGDNLTMLGDVVATSGDEWVFIQRSFEATSDKTVVMLRGLSGTTTSVGNLIDNVYIGCDAEATTECNDNNVPSLDAPQGAYSNSVVDASNVSIYPVPAATNLNIQVDNSGNRVEGTYYITSMNGRASHRGTIQIVNGQSETIQENVASLPEGIYFLVMEINGKIITKRFVKTSR